MKKLIYGTVILFAFIFAGAPSVWSQTQELGGYTVVRGGTSTIICIGRWVPPPEIGRSGYCDGQMVDVAQLTAISARQTVDRLDQVLTVLDSIDQKLTDNNLQIERLIDATVNTQASINQQTGQVGELMHDTITTRVDALARRVLANDTFRKELEKLKQDILTDLKKYSPRE